MTSVLLAASDHPLPTEAVGEVAGELLESGGGRPDLLLVAAGVGLLGALEDICAALSGLLGAAHTVGILSAPLLAGGRALDPASGLFCLALSGSPWSVRVAEGPCGDRIGRTAAGSSSLRLWAGPHPEPGAGTSHGGAFVGTPVAALPGGVAGAAGSLWSDGSLLPGGCDLELSCTAATSVHEIGGLRSLGSLARVTAVRGALLEGLDDRPAGEVLLEGIAAVDPALRAELGYVGLRTRSGDVVDLGTAGSGSVAISGRLEVGETVELVGSTATSTASELLALLGSRRPALALLRLPAGGSDRPGADLAPVLASSAGLVPEGTHLAGVGLEVPSAAATCGAVLIA